MADSIRTECLRVATSLARAAEETTYLISVSDELYVSPAAIESVLHHVSAALKAATVIQQHAAKLAADKEASK